MRDTAESRMREAAANAVPTDWCDVLLTGQGAPRFPDEREVKRLLLSIRERIKSLPLAEPTCATCGGSGYTPSSPPGDPDGSLVPCPSCSERGQV